MKINLIVFFGVLLFQGELYSQPSYVIQESAPIVKVELPSTPFYEQAWFNTMIAALLGIGGTILGFKLTSNREDKRRKDDKMEDLISKLNSYKSKADSLIPLLYKQSIEVMFSYAEQVRQEKAERIQRVMTSTLPGAFPGKRLTPSVEEKYNSTLADFTYNISLFMGLTKQDARFSKSIKSIRTFPINEYPTTSYDGIKKHIDSMFLPRLEMVIFVMDAIILLLKDNTPMPEILKDEV